VLNAIRWQLADGGRPPDPEHVQKVIQLGPVANHDTPAPPAKDFGASEADLKKLTDLQTFLEE